VFYEKETADRRRLPPKPAPRPHLRPPQPRRTGQRGAARADPPPPSRAPRGRQRRPLGGAPRGTDLI